MKTANVPMGRTRTHRIVAPSCFSLYLLVLVYKEETH